MKEVLKPSQAREADQELIHRYGIPGEVLMERAAQGVVRAIDDRVPKDARILILCGPGNNGGDGFAVLRQLHERGRDAEAWLAVSEESLRGDAPRAGCRLPFPFRISRSGRVCLHC